MADDKKMKLHVCIRCGGYYRDGIDGELQMLMCRRCVADATREAEAAEKLPDHGMTPDKVRSLMLYALEAQAVKHECAAETLRDAARIIAGI